MSDDIGHGDDEPADGVDREWVELRVEDWKRRLESLFSTIRNWGEGHGWSVSGGVTVNMNEELMQRFGVPATVQPVLRLDRPDRYALFKPKGLWVIGANGRIDLYTSKGIYVVVDLADYGAKPLWKIFRDASKHEGTLFSPELIESLA